METAPSMPTFECAEDEPDDGFGALPARKNDKGEPASTENAVADQRQSNEEDREASSPPVLEGHWQQLPGVPRPNSGTGPRYLAWSEHGHVAVFPEDRRVELIFSSIPGRPQRLPDTIGLNMAAISPHACCLASRGDGSDGGSQMLIRPAERWDKAVFAAALGYPNEVVEAVACGDEFAACLTSRRVLRVYTLSGVPIGVISVSGEPVTMVARSGCLFVVTRAAGLGTPELDQDDALDFRVLEISSRSQRAAGRLPLSPGARLRWIGFSNEFAPLTLDTEGVVRALLGSGPGSWGPANGGGAEWTVVHQFTHKGSQDGVWMVGCQHSSLLIASISDSCETANPVGRQFEPQPAEIVEGLGQVAGVDNMTETDTEGRRFGFGAPLRDVPWTFSLGQLACAGSLLANAFRESMVMRHVEDVGLATEEGDEKIVREYRATRFKSALFLFASLIKGGEQERALDVASNLLAVAGGSGPLANAQALAERAGLLKLADRIAELPRIPLSAAATNAGIAAKPGPAFSAVAPQMVKSESKPLFGPGEGEENQDQVETEVQETPAPTPARVRQAGASPINTTPGTAIANDEFLNSRQPALSPTSIRHQPAISPTPEQSMSAASEVATAAPTMSARPAAARSNPFARRQQRPQNAIRTPHLLRDALGGGTIPGAPQQELAEPPKKIQRHV